MPTQSVAIERLSTKQLAWVARCAPETATRKLREANLAPVAQDKRTTWWDPRDALPILLGVGDGLNPQQEKARLDSASADLKELELEVRRGALVPAADQDAALIGLATTVAARLGSVAAKVAPGCAVESTPAGCQAIVADAIREACHDLAETGRLVPSKAAGDREPEDDRGSRRRARGDAAAAEPDAARVGRTTPRRRKRD